MAQLDRESAERNKFETLLRELLDSLNFGQYNTPARIDIEDNRKRNPAMKLAHE